jgi:hypothetical protein
VLRHPLRTTLKLDENRYSILIFWSVDALANRVDSEWKPTTQNAPALGFTCLLGNVFTSAHCVSPDLRDRGSARLCCAAPKILDSIAPLSTHRSRQLTVAASFSRSSVPLPRLSELHRKFL